GRWHRVHLPTHVGSAFTSLWGIAAVGPGAIAVGTYFDPVTGTNKTLMLQGGKQWSVVNSPSPGRGDNILGGIIETPQGQEAVGTYDTGGPRLTLIEHTMPRNG